MTTLCVVLLALLTPSASLQIHVQRGKSLSLSLSLSHDYNLIAFALQAGNIEVQHSLSALPRKLKLFEITVRI